VISAALAVSCAGATRVPVQTPASVTARETPAVEAPAAAPEPPEGVVHVVQPGQTLWRIARAYGIPVETLAEANGITDPTRVDVGTPLLVPGAIATMEVTPWPAPPPSPELRHEFRAVPSADFLWPVSGGELMRPFGEPRHRHVHAGVDIRGSLGQSILAARDGVVAFSGLTHGGYGNMVVLDHGDGIELLMKSYGEPGNMQAMWQAATESIDAYQLWHDGLYRAYVSGKRL
jgi:LysM repeat protein